MIAKIPRRFIVTFWTIEGDEFNYSIVTWFGREKAIALAAAVHNDKFPNKSIHEVTVEDKGEPELTSNGYRLEGDEYTDRMEW